MESKEESKPSILNENLVHDYFKTDTHQNKKKSSDVRIIEDDFEIITTKPLQSCFASFS